MRILLAGGGSGGSAAPVIAVAELARRLWPEAALLYVGTTSGPEAALVEQADIPYVPVRAGRLRRFRTWRNLTDPALVLVGLAQAVRIASTFRPDVAFGAGGFATVPPLLAARLQRVPVLVHQQDVVVGLANRMLAPFAARVTVAFPETRGLFRTKAASVVGNPVRSAILTGDPERARRTFGLSSELPVLLVTGGGTGALQLNHITAGAAPDLVDHCQVIHLTGVGKRVPGPSHPNYRQHEFLTADMADALAAADVVVTRAGMSGLSELATLHKPAVLVPMPGSHQEANASAFQRHGAGLVLHERELSSTQLVKEVRSLLADPMRRTSYGDAAARLLPPDAAESICRIIAETISGSGALRG